MPTVVWCGTSPPRGKKEINSSEFRDGSPLERRLPSEIVEKYFLRIKLVVLKVARKEAPSCSTRGMETGFDPPIDCNEVEELF